jgi:kynurenine 3-monooxygenase
MSSSKPILIAGAGLAGCLMAIEVARLGYRVVVIEKRQANEGLVASCRSINLALAPSTLRLLQDATGAGKELAKIVTPLQGRVLHPSTGRPVFQPYAESLNQSTLLNPAAGAVSVSRAELNALLRSSAAQNPNIEFRFGLSVVECNAERAELRTQGQHGSVHREIGEAIIAADGARSAIRRLLTDRRKRQIREDRTTLKHAYKELLFLPSRNLKKPALHIWPRAGFLMMALPNCDGTFRGAIFLPRRGRNGFSALKGSMAVRDFFEKHFSDAMSSLENVFDQFAKTPISSLTSIQCDPWHIGRTILIGDACHTLYPFSGQGANLALEDCIELRRCMEQFAPDWPCVWSTFTGFRKPKVDYLCEATRTLSVLVLSALPQEGILGRV